VRIVHLDTGLELRGGQLQLLLLARGLRARGHEQMIVCPKSSQLESRARREHFRAFALPKHDAAGAHGILALRQQLRVEPYDVLHAHDGRGHTISWFASFGLPVRRVASRRVTFLPRRLWLHRVKYTRTCDAVVAVSQFVRQRLIDSGVPPARVEVIPDGVEIPATLPDAAARARVRARWNWGAQEFVVGFLGAASREKGQDLALQAGTLLRERAPQVRVVLASAPVSGAALPVSSSTIRVERYAGDLADFFAGLDLFIMPSRAEGLGSAALNAMAYGLPVVATRVGGLPEIVEEGETGWLVPPESSQALADAIAAAAADSRLAQLGSNARQRARQFSADIMLDRTEALYRRLMARND
jgi:glycosyltransferase involved in cell wall biosynthesis